MKICLIGLPRCGSQYISQLVKNTSTRMVNLGEPFTFSSGTNCIELVNERIVLSDHLKFNNIQDQIIHTISILAKASTQSCVMKLFLLDYLEPYLPYIVGQLTNLNFKFIVMTRENCEEQLLSFGIALATDKWNSHQGMYEQGDKIQVTHFRSMEWLHSQLCNFERLLDLINSNPLGTVRYEHAVEDLSVILQLPVDPITDLKKQISSSPYDMIENVDEVKEFMKKVINGTQIY